MILLYDKSAMYVLLNGKFVDEKEAKVSVLDNGFLYGDGVYETLRTYGGKIWQVEEHLRRLRSSAAMLDIAVPWKNSRLVAWLERLCQMNGFKESRIRITVTRGVNGMVFKGSKRPTILIQVNKLEEVSEFARKGVKVVTVKWQRLLPEAKTISLLPMILAKRATYSAKAYEALFLDRKGHVLEGAVTNVFMVKNGDVATPSQNVLPGTTAKALEAVLKRAGIRMVKRRIKLSEFRQADEIFLTNAPRGIIPVVNVDGMAVGGGQPGPLTRVIARLFKDYICRNI